MAMTTYRDGLAELPVKTQLTNKHGKRKAEDQDSQPGDSANDERVQQTPSEQSLPEAEDSEVKQVNELRSVLFANVAACCIKMVSCTSSSDSAADSQFSRLAFRPQERWKDAVQAANSGRYLEVPLYHELS